MDIKRQEHPSRAGSKVSSTDGLVPTTLHVVGGHRGPRCT